MPQGVGYVGDPIHDSLVRDIEQQFLFFRDGLKERFSDIVRWRKLYMAKRDDPRDPKTEKWRANVFIPYPYSGVETRVAALTEILNSSDPPIQAEGISDSEVANAKAHERLLNYTLLQNKWRKKQAGLLRDMSVDGTSFFKLYWVDRKKVVVADADPALFRDFEQAVADAVMAGAPRPPDPVRDPQAFQVWREMVGDAGKGKIPDPPFGGRSIINSYSGPWIERMDFMSVYYDPIIEEMSDQGLVVHRVVVPIEWLIARTGDNPDKPFDPSQVSKALAGGDLTRWEPEQDQVRELLGITSGQTIDPRYQKPVEIWECIRPAALEGEPRYMVVLNRKAIINKKPMQMPFQHGECYIHKLCNVPVPGHAMGISELQQPEALYNELMSLRNLRLDAVTLAVLPVLMRMRDMGLTELKRKLSPGAIIDVNRPDALKQLIQMTLPDAAFREPTEIKEEIDTSNATFGNVRGQQAAIGRVSATENQSRLTQALTRMKMAAVSFEEEFNPAVRQMLALWYQFGSTDERIRVGGSDPFMNISKTNLLEALAYNYQFRGATRAINKEMTVQQLMGFYKEFKEGFTPKEGRALMSKVLEELDIKGAGDIVSAEGTQFFTQQWEAQVAQQKAAAEAQAMQQKMQATSAPSEVTPQAAAIMQGEAGGAPPAGQASEAAQVATTGPTPQPQPAG